MKKDKFIMSMKGITLIALVVTIVVLLILAGVSISILTGESGIIRQAQSSKEKTEIGNEREQVNLAYSSAKTKKITNGDNADVNSDDINAELVIQNADAVATGDNPIMVIFNKSKRRYQIATNGEIAEVPETDMKNIFTYDDRGYITGIKEEYITVYSGQKLNNKTVASLKGVNVAAATPTYLLKEEIGTYIVIPETIDGVTICGIADGAFSYIINIKNMLLPNTITSIGDGAFNGCTSLTSITIPNSVTSIGNYAFSGCYSLTSITIPDSVTSIGNYAFYGCSNLTSITIPNNVTSIGDRAFVACSSLTSIIVEEENTVYDSRNNCNAIIEKSSNILISGCNNTIIPDTVTSIGNYAFSGCYSLTSITIPNTVTSIGSSAFSGCTGLTRIIIPNSVTSIGKYAFYVCSKLTTVYYTGTEEQWKAISIGGYNTNLTNATINYNYTGE